MTVGELLNRISSEELTEWLLFSKTEPIGINAHFLGHAITASTVANVNRKKGSKALQAKEFIPKFEEEDQSMDEMLQIAEMITVASGGKDLRK
jgi:hypothetical protein